MQSPERKPTGAKKLTAKAKKAPSQPQEEGEATTRASKKTGGTDDILPGPMELAALFSPVREFTVHPAHERIRNFFTQLREHPPQVLLLEGGTAEQRLAAAHYWALLLNCKQSPVPCYGCSACLQIIAHQHRDLFFFDGQAGSIKIAEIREMRKVLGELPRDAATRVIILCEAQALGVEAANALLKSLEEPRPQTSFLLLCPQRERLLPTLVSRSFTLTLAWPDSLLPAGSGKDPGVQTAPPLSGTNLAQWENSLAAFILTGRGLFEQTGEKGAVDTPLAYALLDSCRRALGACLLGQGQATPPAGALAAALYRLPLPRLRMADEALAECQDSLHYAVPPALVLEWLATRLYLLAPRL